MTGPGPDRGALAWTRRSRLGAAVVRLGLVVAAVALVGAVLVEGVRSDDLAVDLGDAFLPAAAAVWDGSSPYPDLDDPALRAGTAYVYPPLTAVVLAPVSPLPDGAIRLVGSLLLVAVVLATLRALGVGDWRCSCVALLWPPVLSAIQTANVTLLLGLGAALAWRLRDRPLGSGAAVGVTLALKPLLWPLLVWQVATRRGTAVAWAAAWGVALVLVPSAVVGLSWVADYPSLLRELARLEASESYTVSALARDLGLGASVGRVLSLGLLLGLLAASVALARRGDERRAFGVAVVAALAATPIVWLHYFALLLVPVAVCAPTLSAAWFAPLVLWLGTGQQNGEPWQNATVLAGAVATVALALHHPSAETGPRAGGGPPRLSPVRPVQPVRARRRARA